MIQQKFLTVLPKLETYEFRSAEEKSYMRDEIYKQYDWIKSLNLLPYMIAEDELAYELFKGDKDVKWISVLSMMDSIYIRQYTDIYKDYGNTSSYKYRPDFIKSTDKAVKKPERGENQSEEMYLSAIMKIILQRIRTTAKLYIDDFQIVLFFVKGVSLTKKYVPKIGDKKFYVEVNLETGLIEYYFGGVNVTRENFETIVKGIS